MENEDLPAECRLWGNSLGVRLPQSIAQGMGLQPGSLVNIALEGEKSFCLRQDHNNTLKALLKDVTPERQHREVDSGEPVEDESW
ncbi:MAG: AbrB/MazE/SpoVT family DNA-binding domain-containing protein [Thermosynechococcaceae cyanobacterium]